MAGGQAEYHRPPRPSLAARRLQASPGSVRKEEDGLQVNTNGVVTMVISDRLVASSGWYQSRMFIAMPRRTPRTRIRGTGNPFVTASYYLEDHLQPGPVSTGPDSPERRLGPLFLGPGAAPLMQQFILALTYRFMGSFARARAHARRESSPARADAAAARKDESVVDVRVISKADVERLLPMEECVDLMADALVTLARGDAVLPLRQMVWQPDKRGMIGVMPGYPGLARTLRAQDREHLPRQRRHRLRLAPGRGAHVPIRRSAARSAIIDASAITGDPHRSREWRGGADARPPGRRGPGNPRRGSPGCHAPRGDGVRAHAATRARLEPRSRTGPALRRARRGHWLHGGGSRQRPQRPSKART